MGGQTILGRLRTAGGVLWHDVLGHPLVAGGLVAAPFAWVWWHHHTRALAAVGAIVAPHRVEVLRTKTRVVYRPKIVYVYRTAAAKAAGAPLTGRLLAASDVPPSRHSYRVWSELGPGGHGHLYVRRNPYPWFAIMRRGSVGIYEALAPGGAEQIIAADEDLLQVKAFTLQARGTLATHTGWSAGLGIRYHW